MITANMHEAKSRLSALVKPAINHPDSAGIFWQMKTPLIGGGGVAEMGRIEADEVETQVGRKIESGPAVSSFTMMRDSVLPRMILAALVALSVLGRAGEGRTTMTLDGDWQIGEGAMTASPTSFGHQVAVPGLVDMAQPAFEEVGVRSARRDAFWYRRNFRIDGPIPAVAVLKVHKAMFGTRVMLNGQVLGEHIPCFTPGYFDAKAALKAGDNELLIRVGACREALPKAVPNGWDYEKQKFIPGIYDTVELVLSGAPHLARVQAVPDIEKQCVTIHTWLQRAGMPAAAKLKFIVREAASGVVAGEGQCDIQAAGEGPEATGQVTIALKNCRLWSPEDPFLYELEARSAGDVLKTRFGMRSFRLDQATGRAVLNGKPYFLRGSNITLYRFFEDPERGDKPWREEWVRRLHKAVRNMHWNSLRYCIGFPPEFWYRIADEEGILIQDEFPIWNMEQKPGDYDVNELAQEYAEWMRERWNHPCVVIWDACNETRAVSRTGEAIQKVRALDFSNRPWDNGWAPAQAPGDVFESHPYHFIDSKYKLANLAKESGAGTGNVIPNKGKNPVIINEYGWLWLNRDGTPTTLTRDLYQNLLGKDSTTAQRRHVYARYLAAETEFWRSHRAAAGVLHFCALGYARSDGQTSDHWTDVEKLVWEPEFQRYVRDAFAPVGLMIDAWAEEYAAGKPQEFPVVVINDLYSSWQGTVRFRLLKDGTCVQEQAMSCEVPPLGDVKLAFTIDLPATPGNYQVEATLMKSGDAPVRSLRDFNILTEAGRQARFGIAVGKPVQASSSLKEAGATAPEAAVDGQLDTRWSSEFSDPQWLVVDLGKPEMISRLVLAWETAYAKAYSIEVSTDQQTWRQVYQTQDGKGGSEDVKFAPVEARWLRLTGTRRATQFGYSLWELEVFR